MDCIATNAEDLFDFIFSRNAFFFLAEIDTLKSKLATLESEMAELQAQCHSKDQELSQLTIKLEVATAQRTGLEVKSKGEEDADSTFMQDVDVDAGEVQNGRPAMQEHSTKVAELQVLVEITKKERDNATAALTAMKESVRLLKQEFEDSKAESEEVVGQWTGKHTSKLSKEHLSNAALLTQVICARQREPSSLKTPLLDWKSNLSSKWQRQPKPSVVGSHAVQSFSRILTGVK